MKTDDPRTVYFKYISILIPVEEWRCKSEAEGARSRLKVQKVQWLLVLIPHYLYYIFCCITQCDAGNRCATELKTTLHYLRNNYIDYKQDSMHWWIHVNKMYHMYMIKPVQRIGLKTNYIDCKQKSVHWWIHVNKIYHMHMIKPVQRIGLKILFKERVNIIIYKITWISYFFTRKNRFFINLKFFLYKNWF